MAYLDGKTAIVTGAAEGLGRSFAHALAANGANLVIFDIKESVATVADELSRYGRGVLARTADVSRRCDSEQIVEEAVTRFGGVDILVNNAAKWKKTPVTDSWEKALADFDELMDTNVKGVMFMSRLCVPHMRARGGGDIVNISTDYVLPARREGTNSPGSDVYNASKWALNGFTDANAQALAQDNIRVNALAIGPTDTPMLRALFGAGGPPSEVEAMLMDPSAIARLLIDLLRDGRSGENIGVWSGHPIVLGPPKRWDVKMRERADFTGQPLRDYGPSPLNDAPEPVEHLVMGRD